MKEKLISLAALVAAVLGSALFFYSFTKWIPVLYVLSVLLFACAAGLIIARFSSTRRVLRAVICAVIYTAAFFAVAFLINNIIFGALNARISALIICSLNLLFFIIFYAKMSKKGERSLPLAVTAFVLSVVLAFGTMLPDYLIPLYYKNNYKFVAAPVTEKYVKKVDPVMPDADIFVSIDGSDDNDGTADAPFKTIERAARKAKTLRSEKEGDIIVSVSAGEYRVDTLEFTESDSGSESGRIIYRGSGERETVLNGGITLEHSLFRNVTDAKVLERLSEDAKASVLQVDLSSLGITKEQYGKIYAIGGYNTAAKYDGDYVGDIYCELFIDDARQTVARYPNGKDYLYTGKVIMEGEGRESSGADLKTEYESLRNPLPDVYAISRELSDRIASWQTTQDVWMFGYWRYDWADASTPLGSVDHENLTMSPMFVSTFGAKEGAPYYFFNVLEELDSPGEWYLDREKGMLYFYPPRSFSEDSTVELSLSTDNVIKAECDYVSFENLTVKGTRGDGISIVGNGCEVNDCLIKNVAGNALIMTGSNNSATDNEITRTGKGGIILNGGERETLAPGNNRAYNNLIHDWSEIYETYQPAVTLNGVGNICSHNEMFNSPHEAITYSGNDHIIEYNLIHDVNLLTDDGGAIYSGRRWDWYGNVIRYNLIYDLGSDGHKPVGIYMDDAISGQTIYGNVVINAPNIGIQLGGGRDLDVHDNIVINSERPLSYDDRALNGLPGHEDSNFYPHYKQNGDCWKLLDESPWKTETWKKAYPQMQSFSSDFNNTDDPGFVLNPAGSSVTRNVFVSGRAVIDDVADNVYKYSKIEGNALFRLSAMDKLFVDPKNGDYTIRDDAPLDFKPDIPEFSKFGRE